MSTALLHSAQSGELLFAEIRISSKHLEDILEALASAPFPINPELDHSLGAASAVRFPVYESQLPALRQTLADSGFSPNLLQIDSMSHAVGGAAAPGYEATL